MSSGRVGTSSAASETNIFFGAQVDKRESSIN
jgi:hypothetical protein